MSEELKDWVKNLKVGDEVCFKTMHSKAYSTNVNKIGRIWIEVQCGRRFHKYDLKIDGGKDYGYCGDVYQNIQEYEAEVNLYKFKNEIQDTLVDCRNLVHRKSLLELQELKTHLDEFLKGVKN